MNHIDNANETTDIYENRDNYQSSWAIVKNAVFLLLAWGGWCGVSSCALRTISK